MATSEEQQAPPVPRPPLPSGRTDPHYYELNTRIATKEVWEYIQNGGSVMDLVAVLVPNEQKMLLAIPRGDQDAMVRVNFQGLTAADTVSFSCISLIISLFKC